MGQAPGETVRRVVRVPWTSASFLHYAGGIVVLIAALGLVAAISSEHGHGGTFGFAVLIFAVLAALAFGLRRAGHPVAAGVFALAAVAALAVVVGELEGWAGWRPAQSDAFHGTHGPVLVVEVVLAVAAVGALLVFRFPLLLALAILAWWYFLADLITNGGDGTSILTFVLGVVLLAAAVRTDRRGNAVYAFWMHALAGLGIGASLIWFLHSGDADWALVIVASLVYVGFAAMLRRSSYAVLAVVGLLLATGHFAFPHELAIFGDGGGSAPSPWVAPLAYTLLGIFLVFVGMAVGSRRGRVPRTR